MKMADSGKVSNDAKLERLRDKIKFYSELKILLAAKLNNSDIQLIEDKANFDDSNLIETPHNSRILSELTFDWNQCVSELQLALEKLISSLGNASVHVETCDISKKTNFSRDLQAAYLAAGKNDDELTCEENQRAVDDLRQMFFHLHTRKNKSQLQQNVVKKCLQRVEQFNVRHSSDTSTLPCHSVDQLQRKCRALNAETEKISAQCKEYEDKLTDQIATCQTNADLSTIFELDHQTRFRSNAALIDFQSKVQQWAVQECARLDSCESVVKQLLTDQLTKCKTSLRKIKAKLGKNAKNCESMQEISTLQPRQQPHSERLPIRPNPSSKSLDQLDLHNLVLTQFSEIQLVQKQLTNISEAYKLNDPSRHCLDDVLVKLQSIEQNLLDTINMLKLTD